MPYGESPALGLDFIRGGRHSDGVFKEGFGSLISIVIRHCIAKYHRGYWYSEYN